MPCNNIITTTHLLHFIHKTRAVGKHEHVIGSGRGGLTRGKGEREGLYHG